MALRIFDTDPEAAERAEQFAKPAKTYVTDFAFQLRSGMQVPSEANPRKMVPQSLSHWRALAASQETADALAELFGGSPREIDTSSDYFVEVMTEADTLEIVIDGAAAIGDKLTQWGAQGGPIHECDGEFSLLEDDRGEPCGCPPLLADRKDLARKGKGPKPNIPIDFRLAGVGYDLGVARYNATAWTFAETVHLVKNDLDAVDGEALCTLTLETVSYTSKKHGLVEYTKPVIKVLGSYADAVAEPR